MSAFQVAEDRGKPGPGAGASAFDRAFGDAEQPGGVGDRIAVHVDGHHRGALLDGQPHQRPLHRDRGLDLGGPIGDRIDVFERGGGVSLVAAQPIQAGIDHDAVQPAADRGVMPKGAGAAVRREHRVLQCVLGILGAAAGQPGEPVQLPVMAVEQLLEGVAVAGDVGRQQFGVAAFFLTFLPNPAPETHGRTVTNRRIPGTSPEPEPMGQDAACTVTSERAARLWPLVVPSVEIHTSRYDVGDDALTGMLLWPGCTDVGCVSAVVSFSLAGVAVDDERIWIFVPVLASVDGDRADHGGLRQLQHQADAAFESRERDGVVVSVGLPRGGRVAVDRQPGLAGVVGVAAGGEHRGARPA